MQVWFNPLLVIDRQVRGIAAGLEDFGPDFDPVVRPAEPKFGDFQVNGVLGHAKRVKANPRELGQKLIDALQASGEFDPELVELSLAGPGFINFRLTGDFLWQWLGSYSTADDYQSGARELKRGRKVVIDYPSANTAKQAHIGHLRPMVIGEAIARLLDFCGADTIRDNHIGDWGTNFGTLIMKLKRDGIDLSELEGDSALATLDQLY
ncbi:MAG TPA: arginine--tRNA ligase, partial [Opitutales bacterium]|nr:arginine--tRNA ligase [Opitutales bacterium]